MTVESRARNIAFESRHILALALPILLTRMVQRSIGLTNTFLLAAYSTDALAASALALSLYFNAQLFGTGIAAAVSVFVAQSLGKGRTPRDIRLSVRMGLWAAFGLGGLMMVGLYFTEAFLLLISQSPELAAAAGRFARIFALSLPFSIAYGVLSQFAIAVGRPLAPVLVIGVSAVVNVGVNYVLIFGALGFPAMGLEGAAAASCFTYVLSFFLLALTVAFYTPLRRYHVLARFFRVDKKRLIEILKIGLPISMTIMLEVVFFTTSTLMMGYLGVTALAAYQIVSSISATTFLIPTCIANAGTIRVALAVGSGSRTGVQNTGTAAILLGAIVMGAVGVLFVVFREPAVGAFVNRSSGDAAAVFAAGTLFMLFAASYQIFDAVQVTASFVLRGMKDTVVPMWLAVGSYWLVGFPTAVLLGFWLNLGASGILIAFVLALFVASVSMVARFWHLAWARKDSLATAVAEAAP